MGIFSRDEERRMTAAEWDAYLMREDAPLTEREFELRAMNCQHSLLTSIHGLLIEIHAELGLNAERPANNGTVGQMRNLLNRFAEALTVPERPASRVAQPPTRLSLAMRDRLRRLPPADEGEEEVRDVAHARN